MSESVPSTEGIAIIGMAGRFPKADSIAAFWQNLRQGVECVSFFTDEELEEAGIDFPKGNPNYVKARGWLENAERFDAAFFGIHPKEAELIDPQQRIFLECAWEALEDAGYDPEREERPIGVFAGMSMNTYLLANLNTHPELMNEFGYQIMLANDKDFLPTRVSYKLNLKGPSVSIQTACSTSLVAVSVACQHLLNYQCDLALAGGVSITFPQKKGNLYQEGSIISPDGHCRAFDAKAQGTVAGEGAGIVVIKRLADALAERDHIYAVIKGFAINNDGAAKVGFTAPSVDGQAEVIALAQAVADVPPESIGYVVAHGTGTPLGDPIEIAGLTKAFRAGTSAKGFCAIGSVKTNIGHLDAAAGVAGLINAALALHHKEIPPSLHFEAPNPKIDFANSPFYVNTRLTPWTPGPTPRRAGVSSFGIGGTNAHVVLEEAPASDPRTEGNHGGPRLLVLSAKTKPALEQATANLLAHLENNFTPDIGERLARDSAPYVRLARDSAPYVRLARDGSPYLADVAYTLQVGRRAFSHRRFCVSATISEAIQTLEKQDHNRVSTREGMIRENPPIVFLFPGQGSQHPNMARGLYETQTVFRAQVDECAALLKPSLGLDLRAVLYPSPEKIDSARQQLAQTSITQPAIFVISYALAKLWMSWGLQPQAMLGHSVGEYVAACLAGVFSLADALMLVAMRGRLVQEQPPGAMLAVRLQETEIQGFLNGEISLAAVNSPSVCVLSGRKEPLQALQQQLRKRRVFAEFLKTSHAFHSAMMDPVVDAFTQLARNVSLRSPKIPFVSSVTGEWARAEEVTDAGYWGKHLRQTVRFAAALEQLLKEPERILLEVGPGQTLANLARQNPARRPEQMVVASLQHAHAEHNDEAALLTALGHLWLAGVTVDWAKLYGAELPRRVALPTYPFERKKFWVEPVRRSAAVSAASLSGVPLLRGNKGPVLVVETGTGTMPEPAAEDGCATNGTEPLTLPSPRPTGRGETTPLQRKEMIQSMLQKLLAFTSGLEPEKLSAHATFLEMGFDSLFLAQASQTIENIFGARIPFAHILEKFSTLDLLAAHLAEIVPSTAEAEAKLNALVAAAAKPAVNSTPKPEPQAPWLLPLTEGQQEIWFASQVGDEACSAFNLALCFKLRGAVDEAALQQAIQDLAGRHESLRASFPPDGQQQKIAPHLKLGMPVIDWSLLPAPEREKGLEKMMREEAGQPFDLVNGPLLRARLLRLEPELRVVLLTIHHLACDGGSLPILQKELGELYSAHAQGRAPVLPAAPSYSDYVQRQAATAQESQRAKDEAYWLEQFASPPSPLDLPLDLPGAKTISRGAYPSGFARFSLDGQIHRGLKHLSASCHCTLFTSLLSVYYLLLSRLAGQEDVVVGIPVTLRSREETEKLVGSCVNFMPLRLRVNEELNFTEHLAHVQKTFFDAFDHHKYSYGRLIQKLNSPRDGTRAPLVAATFNLQRRGELPSLPGLEAEQVSNPRRYLFFDLIFDLAELERGILLECSYRADLFQLTTIQRWLSHFQSLVSAILVNPDQPLREFRLPEPPRKGVTRSDHHRVTAPSDYQASPTLNPIEERLAQIWREVIGLKQVGLHDNFFDLGGHSVLVMQILSRVRAAFQVRLTLRSVFEAPTIYDLAKVIENRLLEEVSTMSEEKAQQLSQRTDLVLKE